MAEDRRQRIISDLPPELALRICSLLDGGDLVNACASIPGWNWILSTAPFPTIMCRYIDRWMWLDKRLCQLLLQQPSDTISQNVPKAIQYQNRESWLCRRFLSTPSQPKAPQSAHFSILPNPDVEAMSEEEVALRLEGSNIPLFGYISILKYRSRTRIVGMHGCIQMGVPVERGDRDGHGCCDCIIYLVNPSRFLMDDFRSTLEHLAPHQKLTIAVLINGERDKSSGMKCLMQFLERLGGFNASPLAAVATSWRMWCIKHNEGKFANWSELLDWSFYDVIRGKIESRVEGDAVADMGQVTRL